MLLREGMPSDVARIARTHGQWRIDANVCIEDLMVALADKSWRGGRDDHLESTVVKAPCGRQRFNVLGALNAVSKETADGLQRFLHHGPGGLPTPRPTGRFDCGQHWTWQVSVSFAKIWKNSTASG